MTAQLDHWRGQFGDDYISRNEATPANIQPLTRMWGRMLERVNPSSILEVGANIGMNLRAIRAISNARLAAVEPNNKARSRLYEIADEIFDDEICNLPFEDTRYEIGFTAGVLIHVDPAHLARACREMVRVSSRYVLCAEYFSQSPREVNYRGNGAMLWTRDFGKFYLDTCPELRCVDYGFFWTGAGAIDNLTWWLFEK